MRAPQPDQPRGPPPARPCLPACVLPAPRACPATRPPPACGLRSAPCAASERVRRPRQRETHLLRPSEALSEALNERGDGNGSSGRPERSEQPTQESPLRPVLHVVRTRWSVQPRQKLSVIHARTTAHLRAFMQRLVLLVCTLKQRLSVVRFSGVRYSRSCAWSISAYAHAARALTQCARSLTQCTRLLSVPVAHATCVAGPDVAAATVLPLSRL